MREKNSRMCASAVLVGSAEMPPNPSNSAFGGRSCRADSAAELISGNGAQLPIASCDRRYGACGAGGFVGESPFAVSLMCTRDFRYATYAYARQEKGTIPAVGISIITFHVPPSEYAPLWSTRLFDRVLHPIGI